METNGLLLVSLILLVSSFTLGAIDGVWFHLQRYRLFEHSESRYEHCLHTMRAWLAVPAIVLLFLLEPSKPVLLAAAACVLADQLVLVFDLLAERSSRRAMGGISHAEYMVHVGANGLHAVALALAFASAPLDRWTAASDGLALSPLPGLAHWFVAGLAVVAVFGAIQHLLLLREPLVAAPRAGEVAAL